jgi:glycosyltransferase involved in cell wall biosynthesis
LTRIFQQERPHIVHTHTSKAGILGRWAARIACVPAIIHTPHGHVFWGYFNRWISSFYTFLEKRASSFTDRIITLTAQEKEDHLRLRIAPEEKFAVIHSGVDLLPLLNVSSDIPRLKKELEIPEGAPVVGTVGRLTPIKGHRHLIEAARLIRETHPDCFFLIAGDGELRSELDSLANNLGVHDRVIFLGWRPDVAAILSLFDIFAFPSLNEGMGKALVEAMSMGIPAVASAVGGIVNLIDDTRNGLLVPPANAEVLAYAIESLISDPSQRAKISSKAKKSALQYSAESMVQKIDALYLSLMDSLSDPVHR